MGFLVAMRSSRTCFHMTSRWEMDHSLLDNLQSASVPSILAALILSKSTNVVVQLCLTLCDPMDCSTPGSPVLHYLPEFA